MVNHPIHLTILRRGDVHIVDLAEVQAIIPRSETRVDGAFLEEISQEIKRITNLVGPEFRKVAVSLEPETRRNPYVVKELKNLGSLIFSHLLTEAARQKLRSSESTSLYLRLDDQLVHIPWELAFDGQHFLGMKFRVGRQIITHHRASQVTPLRVASDALRVLIVSDPSETLGEVSRESEQLCEILDGIPGLRVRLVGGRGVKRIPLLAALRESDLVHFAGHSQFDEKNPENSGWLLHDGLLSASEISKLDQAPLLVFSNSCQAGATKSWQSDYLFEGEAFGLGSAFLLAGVRNYVGTFCVVHDEESRFLAVDFYRRIAQGKSIGQALLEARLATAEEMGLDRLTWASYMLYGDPDFSPLSPQSSVNTSSFALAQEKVAILPEKPEISANHAAVTAGAEARPAVSHRLLAWLSGGLLAAVLAGFLLFMWWRPTKVIVEAPTGTPTPPVSGEKKESDPGLQVAMGDKQAEGEPSIPAVAATKPASPPASAAADIKPSTKAETGPVQSSPPAAASREEPKPQAREEKTASSEPLQPAAGTLPAPGHGEAPTVTQSRPRTEELPPRPRRPKPSQDLRELKVEVDRLQVAGGEVIIFMRILNKMSTDLAIVLGDTLPFMTDNKGFSYINHSLSGIKDSYRSPQNWTFIPSYGEHTLSMRFIVQQYGARAQRDSIYSMSVEVILATRDSVERQRMGYMPERARIVNISIHGIEVE